MPPKGTLFVISAPSGAGKSTLCARMLKKYPNMRYSISYTTRPMRKGEKNGVDYYFVDEATFKKMADKGAFVEWACVHGNYYGTPLCEMKKMVQAGFDVVLDIDVQGGLNIKRLFPDAVLVFIMTPSLALLEQRLRGRNKDSDETIRRRLANARKELRSLPQYQYLVINDDLSRASDDLAAVITAEHLRTVRGAAKKFK